MKVNELFFKDFYADADKSFVFNDALSEIIFTCKQQKYLALGAKIFMQEEHNYKNKFSHSKNKKRNVKHIKVNSSIYSHQNNFQKLYSGF